MAGGTSVPPQDSRCEPWSGQRKDFWLEKEKTCGRTKRSRRSDGEVSLDNADAVIEGAPHVGFTCGGFALSVPRVLYANRYVLHPRSRDIVAPASRRRSSGFLQDVRVTAPPPVPDEWSPAQPAEISPSRGPQAQPSRRGFA